MPGGRRGVDWCRIGLAQDNGTNCITSSTLHNQTPPLPNPNPQRKLADMRRAIMAKRNDLEQLRLERLSDVARAAREVARAIRQERRAAQRRSNMYDSDLSRKIDAAMLDSLSAGPGSVLSAIDDFQRAAGGRSGSSSSAAAAAALGGKDDWWAPAWRGLLQEARAALAAAQLAGTDLDTLRAGGGGGGGSSGAIVALAEDDLAAEVEALEKAAARRAAARAAKEARRERLLQQAVAIEQAKRLLWKGDSADAAAAAAAGLTAEGAAQLSQEQQLPLVDADEDDDEDLDDLGLGGIGLDDLERGRGNAAARRQREREAVAALSRLEEALSRVDVAAEGRGLAEEMARREAELSAMQQREAAARWVFCGLMDLAR